MRAMTSISIDPEVLKRARECQLNISGECESALRMRTRTTKKDIPEEQLQMKCFMCGELVEDGYLCEYANRFVCMKCHEDYNCHSSDHKHLRIPGLNEYHLDIAERIAQNGSNKQK